MHWSQIWMHGCQPLHVYHSFKDLLNRAAVHQRRLPLSQVWQNAHVKVYIVYLLRDFCRQQIHLCCWILFLVSCKSQAMQGRQRGSNRVPPPHHRLNPEEGTVQPMPDEIHLHCSPFWGKVEQPYPRRTAAITYSAILYMSAQKPHWVKLNLFSGVHKIAGSVTLFIRSPCVHLACMSFCGLLLFFFANLCVWYSVFFLLNLAWCLCFLISIVCAK